MAAPSISFEYLLDTLQADADVREQIRDAVKSVERAERSCLAVLNRVHVVGASETLPLLATIDPLLPPLRSALADLAVLVPATQFYRYNDHFARALQSAAFIVVLDRFLRSEQVASKDEVEQALGIVEAWRDHFFLPIEDYLHSLISLLNELSRLAVNRVTLGDFQTPVRYARFAKELSSAFGLLNLKNDNLRKRFDGIKYDVKKLEEVVYDLSLRGLTGARAREDDDEGQGASKRARGEEEMGDK